ncbi:MOSC domain-containing protein [Rhizobium leguminosarum bv. trifolii]|uniref:MOSC domain-containing protein n=1 Tax=Rhizobium leguminosarum bv. trifolii TaxID=386 RepID=A0A3E1B0A7_RHILT|nr:MOSC N-terminal beta barrel domain-containing protein [Rhizobium leguminosarum]RFB83122.1 MOSC domain-containing protein [Rhizobium leguminosarum bv. trifolii]RFB83498.1 MOSC domain-containing protein [Rhizobium leguminosarum bv. trifolii]
MNSGAIGIIEEIWRYPVSSVGGESLSSARLGANGVLGDRIWCLVDPETNKPASPETDERWRAALFLRSRLGDTVPEVGFPDGEWFTVTDERLSPRLERHFSFPVEARPYGNGDPTRVNNRYQLSPVHLVTTASLDRLSSFGLEGGISIRRFRPTILLRTDCAPGFVESSWIGRDIRVGSVMMRATEETKRCGMTMIAQPGMAEDPEILRAIVRQNRRNLGIYCEVTEPSIIAVGDQVTLA